uniref:BMA-LIPS-9 n=1 Tax=Brugia malayi TaxID=6279 RepID=A0A0I9NA45_BRUMA|nr:BMA-LIPS-9 [Brugia malayi]
MLKQLLVILFSEVSNAHFTDDFNTWLMEVYGSDVQTTLNRADLGRMGSFGGKQYRDQMLTNDPIVFVHGVSNTAGEQPFIGASYFLAFGYDWSELYATTYANGAEGNPMQWAKYTMNCKYVKQIRGLIVAVRLYTGRAVDVIAYSLGVPVARKAILGGLCVDTKENLGNPLTSSIDTFVGIAGPNHGVMLKDINSVIGYEGKNIFTIYSKGDQLVGYNICGKITSQITGQHGEKVYNKKDHNETFRDSLPVQLQMILHHIVI